MATLTVTHTESLVLNNRQLGSTNTFNITGVDMSYSRIMKCTANQRTTLVNFRTNEHDADSAVDTQETKYVRVTNLETANSLNLGINGDDGEGTGDQNNTILLAAGESYVMGVASGGMKAKAEDHTSSGSLDNVVSLEVHPGSNSVSVEIFVAGSES